MAPKTKINQNPSQSWRELLHMGEELLGLTSTIAQCKRIEKWLEKITGVGAKVWLLEPYYPLPGEPQIPLLKISEMDDSVQAVIHSKTINIIEIKSNKVNHEVKIILPLITDGNVLGVVLLVVTNKTDPRFRSGVVLDKFKQEMLKGQMVGVLSKDCSLIVRQRVKRGNIHRNVDRCFEVIPHALDERQQRSFSVLQPSGCPARSEPLTKSRRLFHVE